jgi:hypothetical protein
VLAQVQRLLGRVRGTRLELVVEEVAGVVRIEDFCDPVGRVVGVGQRVALRVGRGADPVERVVGVARLFLAVR